jgi:hypothetical protein
MQLREGFSGGELVLILIQQMQIQYGPLNLSHRVLRCNRHFLSHGHSCRIHRKRFRIRILLSLLSLRLPPSPPPVPTEPATAPKKPSKANLVRKKQSRLMQRKQEISEGKKKAEEIKKPDSKGLHI